MYDCREKRSQLGPPPVLDPLPFLVPVILYMSAVSQWACCVNPHVQMANDEQTEVVKSSILCKLATK
jgi:hypothetical protein